MTRRTRYFLIGSVAILVVGFSIGVVAYFNGGLPALKATSAPDELRYVPSDAVVVAYANVREVMSSEFRKRLRDLEGPKSEKGRDEFRDETGIDIERDIDSVVAFMTAETNGDRPEKGGAVIAVGRFDEPRIATLVKEKGGTVGNYNGRTLMTFGTRPRHEEEGDRPGALAFLANNVVIVGSADTVRSSLDLSAKSDIVNNNPKLMELIQKVDEGNAWVVGRFDALRNQARLPDQVMSQIPPISWFSASTMVDGGLSGTLSVETADQAAADNLRKVAEGLMGLAGLQARSGDAGAQLQQLLNSFQLSQKDNTLTLSFSIPSDLLNALARHDRKPARDQ